MHNCHPELLTKTPTQDISTGIIKQQYEHMFHAFSHCFCCEAEIE